MRQIVNFIFCYDRNKYYAGIVDGERLNRHTAVDHLLWSDDTELAKQYHSSVEATADYEILRELGFDIEVK